MSHSEYDALRIDCARCDAILGSYFELCVGSQEALKTLYSDLRYDKTPLGHQDGLRSCLDETQGECVRVNDMRRLSLQSTPRVVENIALSTRRL